MEIRDNRSHYAFGGTDFELRVWEDPQGHQKPVFLIEELPESKNTLLARDREALARALTERVGLTPDEVTWVEQKPNGDLQRFEFTYSYTQRIIPDGNDMDADEARRAADQREIPFEDIPHYDARPAVVSPEEKGALQAVTGDALISHREAMEYNKAQEAEMASTALPSVSVPMEELAQIRRNEPDLTD